MVFPIPIRSIRSINSDAPSAPAKRFIGLGSTFPRRLHLPIHERRVAIHFVRSGGAYLFFDQRPTSLPLFETTHSSTQAHRLHTHDTPTNPPTPHTAQADRPADFRAAHPRHGFGHGLPWRDPRSQAARSGRRHLRGARQPRAGSGDVHLPGTRAPQTHPPTHPPTPAIQAAHHIPRTPTGSAAPRSGLRNWAPPLRPPPTASAPCPRPWRPAAVAARPSTGAPRAWATRTPTKPATTTTVTTRPAPPRAPSPGGLRRRRRRRSSSSSSSSSRRRRLAAPSSGRASRGRGRPPPSTTPPCR